MEGVNIRFVTVLSTRVDLQLAILGLRNGETRICLEVEMLLPTHPCHTGKGVVTRLEGTLGVALLDLTVELEEALLLDRLFYGEDCRKLLVLDLDGPCRFGCAERRRRQHQGNGLSGCEDSVFGKEHLLEMRRSP